MTPDQAVAHRLHVDDVDSRLPAGSFVPAAPQAVYVLPEADLATSTPGRTSYDPEVARAVDVQAEAVCRDLVGQERQGALHPDLRGACVSGRLAVRWTTSALVVREVPRPAVDLDVARADLCRRHVEAFGPTTPAAFAWLAGVPAADARRTWALVADELLEVDLDGTRAWVPAVHEEAVRDPGTVRGVAMSVGVVGG